MAVMLTIVLTLIAGAAAGAVLIAAGLDEELTRKPR